MPEKISDKSAEFYNYIKKTRLTHHNLYDAYIGENKMIFVEFKFKTQVMAMQKQIDIVNAVSQTPNITSKFSEKDINLWREGLALKAQENYIEFAPDIIKQAYNHGQVLYSAFFKYDCFYLVFGSPARK